MSFDPKPLSAAVWFKSSYSGGNATECVECAYLGRRALIRDSKHSRGPVLSVGTEAWRRFVDALHQGVCAG
ncbi:DUF397 domain-containing protein [Streptomyces sp. NPDC096048]|uniref:DUF397 domain-containing protein n=1 Tax=Streptomyces sp. NPDC096048 TaxID=3366072 RepID=UPI0037F3E093